MLSLYCLSLPQLSLITNFKKINPYSYRSCSLSSSSSSCIVHAVDKNSQQYEIDPDKAREALQILDQQLQDLSKKQVRPPKIKVSDVKLTRDQTTEEEVPETSGSFLVFVTAALFLFTIFYNILYITVIEPSTNGPKPTLTTDLESESPELAVLQLLPLAPEVFM